APQGACRASFFVKAEDGIRVDLVTGVQTCALPISPGGPFPGGNAVESVILTTNNQYQFQLEHASLVSAQIPDSSALLDLTSQVRSEERRVGNGCCVSGETYSATSVMD